MKMEPDPTLPPHVLVFPFPALGHVHSHLALAELLSPAGFKITFLNFENIHQLLIDRGIAQRFKQYHAFEFKTISDGLPVEHPRTSADRLNELFTAMKSTTKPIFKEFLTEIRPQVSCILGDGILGFLLEVGNEMGIPIIHFRTISACSFWAYFSIHDMIKAQELPVRGDEDMDRLITKVPGMEAFLRCRDLPSFCRVSDMADPSLQLVMNETLQSTRAHALILNTFEDLEAPILSQIRTQCPKTYSIGALHHHLKVKLTAKNQNQQPYRSSNNSLWAVDRSCIAWLDKQPPQSVLYVSFGSITVVTREQLMEFWHGLVNSQQRFLWVLRPDSVTKNANADKTLPKELEAATRERGFIVEWAPQEEVLAHKAVGGFLTHSGWNSTLESIVAGVPMICWPYFADQQINSRFVEAVWGLGLDMKDVCDRKVVEKMVNDLMVEKRDEFAKSAARMAELATKSVSEGGTSHCNLERLIEDIRLLSTQKRSRT